MTTDPNELMVGTLNCMPVILGTEDHDRWLDLDADPADLLKPCPGDWLGAYPVDKRVGNVRNKEAGIIRRQMLTRSPLPAHGQVGSKSAYQNIKIIY